MGFFDFLKGGSKKDSGDGKTKKSSPAAKWAEAAGSKRAQAYDRQEAINELSKLGSADACCSGAPASLHVQHGIAPITDQEEKELAFEGILKAGGRRSSRYGCSSRRRRASRGRCAS